MTYDYSGSYWRSCQFRFKNRQPKIKFDCQLKNGIEIHRYHDEPVTAYYLIDNGKLIGTIAGHKSDDGFYISISSVNPEKIGQGYGTILYEYIINKYKCVYSDTDRSFHGNAMWNKLKRTYPNVKYIDSRYCLQI